MPNNEAKIKISADVKELKQGVTTANAHIKAMRSELRLNEAQFKNTGDKSEYLKSKHQTLSAMLVENANKQDALNKQLELAQKAEDTTQIEKLKVSLNYAKIEEENLKSKISECDAELERQKQAEAELQSPFDKLNKTISDQKSELEDLKTQYKNVALEQGTDSKEAKELKSKIDTLNKELDENESQLKKVEDAAESTGKEMNDSAKGGWTVFKGVVSNIATDALRKAGDALKEFAGDVIETGKGFDTAMSQVAATMGTTVDQITNMKDKAKEMGATTEWTATQSAEAMNYLALAGYSADQACSTLPTVLNLASAGAMDLADASDMVTDAMTALGIEADADGQNITVFGDKMAKTASKSNTSVSQLGNAILTVGGTAKMLTGGTTELNAALGILADNSIKGSEGGTKLRNIILAMKPTTDKAVAGWEQLGVSAYDADGQMRPLQDTFADLNKAMSGMSDEDKTELLKNMFNKADLAAVNSLLATSSDRWDELSTAIDDSAGAMADMASTQLDNLQGDLTLMDSAMDGLRQTVYDEFAPELREVVQYVTNDVIPAITDTIKWLKEHKTTMAVVAGAIGAVTLAIGLYCAAKAVGTAMNGAEVASLGALIAAKWAEVTANFAVAASGMAAIAPYLLVAAAIAAVIAIIVLCVKHWDQIKKKVTEVASSIGSKISNMKTKVVGVFQTIVNWVKKNWQGLLLLIVNPFAGAFKLAYDNCEGFRNKVNSVFTSIKTKASSIFQGIKNAITTPIQNAKNTLTNIVNSIKSTFSNLSIKLPHINLPHFKISGGKAPYGLGGQGTAPSFKIDWYAKGAVFSKPTLLSHLNGIAGVGEAGPEAVAPVSVLKRYIQDAVDVSMSTMVVIDYVKLAQAMAQIKTTVAIGDREFGRLVRKV